MKKFRYGIAAKGIAMVLCVFSLLGSAACIMVIQLFGGHSEHKIVLENGYKQIAYNYSAYLLDHLNTGYDRADLAADVVQESNLDYLILRSFTTGSFDKLDMDNLDQYYVAGNEDLASDYEYVFFGYNGMDYTYNIDSCWNALSVYIVNDMDYEEMTSSTIVRYLFCPSTGLFYYQVPEGYIPATEVYVQNNEGEEEYYYLDLKTNRYTAKGGVSVFDPYDYKEWKSVWLNKTWHQIYPEQTLNSQLSKEQTMISIGPDLTLSFSEDMIKGSVIEDPAVYIENGDAYYHFNLIPDVSETVPYYWVLSSVDRELPKNDLFRQLTDGYNWIFSFREYALVIQLLLTLVFLVSFVFLICAAGHRKTDSGIYLHAWDRFPLELVTLVVGLAEVIVIGSILYLVEQTGNFTFLVLGTEAAAAGGFLLIAYVMGIAVRIKSKSFWKNTLLYWLVRLVKKCWDAIQKNWPLFWKTMLFIWLINLAEALLLLLFGPLSYDSGEGLFLFLLIKIGESAGIVWVLFQMNRLQKGCQRIVKGDLTTPIDTRGLIWEFKKHAENINKMSDGIGVAVEKQMKSERFRTELITNVSHDIKTPLTSIINYVDLMKKEEITDEVLLNYVDVLDRQSARLKKLTDDLLEASKAATGNLKVNPEPCDISVLLEQLAGEYEEQVQAKHLELIVTKPEHPVVICADGRHLWRIFDNLLNNICKYAMQGTRVYFNLESTGNEAVIVFRNISSSQLNISSDELLERFVRGDSSRNTEGSGLGLSIALSLTELMNGRLYLDIDGDLFKVTLTFPMMNGGS